MRGLHKNPFRLVIAKLLKVKEVGWLQSEAVADTDFCLQMMRLRWINFQLLPQVTDVNAQVVAALDVRRPPYLAQQLTMRHHLPGIGNERNQQPVKCCWAVVH